MMNCLLDAPANTDGADPCELTDPRDMSMAELRGFDLWYQGLAINEYDISPAQHDHWHAIVAEFCARLGGRS